MPFSIAVLSVLGHPVSIPSPNSMVLYKDLEATNRTVFKSAWATVCPWTHHLTFWTQLSHVPSCWHSVGFHQIYNFPLPNLHFSFFSVNPAVSLPTCSLWANLWAQFTYRIIAHYPLVTEKPRGPNLLQLSSKGPTGAEHGFRHFP